MRRLSIEDVWIIPDYGKWTGHGAHPAIDAPVLIKKNNTALCFSVNGFGYAGHLAGGGLAMPAFVRKIFLAAGKIDANTRLGKDGFGNGPHGGFACGMGNRTLKAALMTAHTSFRLNNYGFH